MATASPPSSTDKSGGEPHYRKPQPDLYTLMLAVALAAILLGILFLVFDNQVYEWKMKDTIPTGAIARGWQIGPWLRGFLG